MFVIMVIMMLSYNVYTSLVQKLMMKENLRDFLTAFYHCFIECMLIVSLRDVLVDGPGLFMIISCVCLSMHRVYIPLSMVCLSVCVKQIHSAHACARE